MSKIKGTTDMANMKDFLTAYFNRLIFREMEYKHYDQFVQFCGYIKDKKATDNQKIWAEENLEKDSATNEFKTNPAGLYISKQMPDPDDATDGLSDAEWLKLYKAFRHAFQNMDANRKDFKYNKDATEFLDNNFGTGKLFQHTWISEETDKKIYTEPSPPSVQPVKGTLYYFLEQHRRQLESRFRLLGGYYGVIDDDFTYDDLLKGIKEGKHKTKLSFRKKLLTIVEYIEGSRGTTEFTNLNISSNDIPDMSDYDTWFNDDIATSTLDAFKRKYTDLLNALRNQSKVRDVFSKHDEGKICGPLNKALGNLTYDDPKSEDYVKPKNEDELSVTQRISEWWSDTYSDTIEKYVKFKGDELFFSNEAKAICKGLPKDLKKTDNMDTVLKGMATAKEKLTAKRDNDALKHLKWFEETMGKIKNNPNMKNTYEGALQHGGQTQAMARAIIKQAIADSETDSKAIEKAKTALELLSVLHFGFTTSKVMDEIKKTDFTLLSHNELSWNKNKGMQLITNALDKTVKWAIKGIGYGVTMAKNAYSLSKTKITGYSNGKDDSFKKLHDKYLEDNANKKTNKEHELLNRRQTLTDTEARINSISNGRTPDETKNALNSGITSNKQNIEDKKSELDKLIKEFKTTLNAYNAGARNTGIDNIDAAEEFASFIINAQEALQQKPIRNIPTTPTTGMSDPLLSKLQTFKTYWKEIEANQEKINKARQELNEFQRGIESVEELKAQIQADEREIAHWDENHLDKMEELVKHWNLLETGRNTKTGPMYNWFRRLSKKKAQKDLDNNKAAIIAQYNATHSIAA